MKMIQIDNIKLTTFYYLEYKGKVKNHWLILYVVIFKVVKMKKISSYIAGRVN